MSPSAHAQRFAAILATRPDLAFDFYRAASEIVDDFEEWGPVLQANENGEYDADTAIKRLQVLRNEIIELTRKQPR